jgi:hypothetical protein
MSALRTVAALYIDPRGPYPKMPVVDCWDETRDADRYAGAAPIVAHPPCGPWGALRHRPPPRDPTHWVSGFRSTTGRNRYASNGSAVPAGIKVCSAQQRRRTPPAFAEWLVSLARSVQR